MSYMEKYFTFKFFIEIIPIVILILTIVGLHVLMLIVDHKRKLREAKNKCVHEESSAFSTDYLSKGLDKYEYFGTYQDYCHSLIVYNSNEKYTLVQGKLGDNSNIYGYFKTEHKDLIRNKTKIGCYLDNRTADNGKKYYVFEVIGD